MPRLIALLATLSASLYAVSPQQPNPKNLAGSDWSGIQAEYERHRQAAFPVGGGYQARNYSQQWVTRFDGRGFDVTPDAANWRWGLELRGYGFPGQERSVGNARAAADVEKLSYRWDSTMTEWFVNGRAGLEHGFMIASRPGNSASVLALHLGVRGSLTPHVSTDGSWVSFLDDRGVAALNYAGLKVTDAQGRELAARFTREPRGLRLEVEERNARYPITIDPFAQQAYLKPAAVGSTQAGDWFGFAVAVSGDTVVVGAPQEGSSTTGINTTPNELAGKSGAAYVFVRTAGVWSQQAYLKPAAVGTTQVDDRFGWSVAISGDTVVVGAIREDSPTTGVNSTPAEGAQDSGAAYVFTRSAGVWSQQAYLKPAAVGTTQVSDEFGYSVAVDVDTIVVGAYGEASSTTGINSAPDELASGAGAAYVFTRTAGVWSQQAYLKPAAVGTTQANDHFGAAVGVSGDTVVVGAFQEDSSSTGINSTPNELAGGAGAAYVFFRNGGVWGQQAYLKPAVVGTTQAGDSFGISVAVSGDTVVVGANAESSSTTGINSTPNEASGHAGAAYVFTRTAGVWSQQAYVKPSTVGTSQTFNNFGWSVGVSGNTMVVGAVGEASSTTGVNSAPNKLASGAGAAFVFIRSAGVWSERAYLKPGAVGSTQAGDNFGWSVAVSGGTVVVGAYLEDSSTLGVNSVPDESAIDSGAAYVFTLSLGTTINDFAGDGLSGALLYDPSSGQSFTARSNGDGTYSYVSGTYSAGFNILLTGDFNGDRKADLILYNSQTALGYIGFGNGDGTFNFQSLFWSPGYNAVATGDLNGDGKTDVVLYNSTTGTLYTGISNGSGGFTYTYRLVSQNFTFVRLADFTGDGKADVFLYRSTDGLAFLGVGDGAGGLTFNPLSISAGYTLADIGDLNGDGKQDVILYNPATGSAATGISNGTNGFAFTPMAFSPGFTSVRLADYTGDGFADVIVYNKDNAAAYFGLGTGTGTFNFQSLSWSPGYDFVGAEDVNGDGKADVILYNSTTGAQYTGISNGDGTFNYTYSFWGVGKVLAQATAYRSTPVAGDFDGNRVPDFVWMNNSSRAVTVNYFGGNGGSSLIGWNWLNQAGQPGWHLAAVADFDGNGIPDLVWANDSTKQVTVNYYGGPGGTTLIGYNFLYQNAPAGWHIVGAGDFDNNGTPDLVWMNDTTNQVTVNYFGGSMGATFLGWNYLNSQGNPGWHVVAVADFNGDGVPDLVWMKDDTHQVTVHYYGGAGGATFSGWNFLNSNGVPGWHILGARDFDNNGTPDLVWYNDSTSQITVNYYSGFTLTGFAFLYPSGSATGWTPFN